MLESIYQSVLKRFLAKGDVAMDIIIYSYLYKFIILRYWHSVDDITS